MATGFVSITNLDNTVAESSSETEVKVIKCNHKWTIKNFSFFSMETGVPLHSLIFGSEIHEGVEWRLTLYPGGKDDESKDNVSCYVQLVTSSYGDMVAKFKLYILGQNGKKKNLHETFALEKFEPAQSIKCNYYVSRKNIFDKDNGLLSDDILTICCEIAASPGIPRTIQGSCEKNIKLSYTWVIENFSFIPNVDRQEVASPVFFYPARCKLKWQLRFTPWYLSGSNYYVSLYLCSVSDNKTDMMVRVKLSLINSKHEKPNVSQSFISNFLKTPDRYGYNVFEDRAKITYEANGFLPDDKLTVLCEMVYSGKYHDDVDESDPSMPTIPACRLSDDLEMLFTTKKSSDVTLVIGEREIQAHKTVLVARSSVFSAMFEHQMEEQTSNKVEINDIDYDVLEDMLRFMYTGKANHVSDMAAELLKAADKYDLERLKVICERELFSHIAIGNAMQLFMLADAHRSEYLKTAVIQFIAKERVAITESEDFQMMTESHPQFICDLLDRLSLLE